MDSLSPGLNDHSNTPASETKSGFSPRALVDRTIKVLTHTDVGLVLLVFFLGFIVRAQLMRYELFFEFDSYWHARMISYILQGLPAPMFDPLAYYHNVSAATITNAPVLFWYISAAFYKIFTLNGAYDFETWILFVKILPALYGAFIVAAMFYLGKELFKGPHEKAAGLLAALFAAIIPAFVYRTMGGFFEDDSLGFIWMVVGFVFLVRALREPAWKKQNIIHAVLAGASFMLMVFTWPAFNMLVPILLGVGVLQFLLWVREKEYTHASAFGKLWLVSFVMLGVAATIHTGTFWLSQFGGILGSLFLRNSDAVQWEGVIVFISALLLAGFALLQFAKRGKIPDKWVNGAFAIVVLGVILAPFIVNIFDISLSLSGGGGQSIGEESEGRTYFGNKYSFLIIFLFVGLPAIGYLLWKRPRHFEVLVLPLVWAVVAFFMAWGKLKFTYYLGLPLALMSGVVCVLALKWMTSHSVRTKKITALMIGFVVIGGIAAGTFFVTQNVPNIESSWGWKTALFWADDNLPTSTKFLNWWDEGHWISFLSQRGVLIDNRNADPKAASDVGLFIVSENESVAIDIAQKYGSTHVILGDDLLSKLVNMGFYAYNTGNTSDPRLQGVFGAMIGCSLQTAPVTREQTYACGSNSISVQEYEAFPTTWQSAPNNTQNGQPFHLYRDEEKTRLFAFTPRANGMTLVRLWMSDPSITGFTEIYRNTGGVRIYEVNPPAPVSPADENATI